RFADREACDEVILRGKAVVNLDIAYVRVGLRPAGAGPILRVAGKQRQRIDGLVGKQISRYGTDQRCWNLIVRERIASYGSVGIVHLTERIIEPLGLAGEITGAPGCGN